MNLPDKTAYEIKHGLIDELQITGEVDRSGVQATRTSTGELIKFELAWKIAWQVPGETPTRIYAIKLIKDQSWDTAEKNRNEVK